jgi:hypothetical protein
MTERHPDSPRPDPDDELNEETRRSSGELGRADLDEQLSDDERRDLANDREGSGQNSDWTPQ